MTGESIHGGALAYAGAGILILGPSGSGKSRLMADMMALGARLVADDRVLLSEQSGMVMAGAPKELSGILELRGLGLIRIVDTIPRHVIHLVVELVEVEGERIPEQQTTLYLGRSLPLLRVPSNGRTSASALLLYIKAMQEGRSLPPDWRPTA